MKNYNLFIVLGIFSIFGSSAIIYPLRRHKKLLMCLLPISLILIGASYWYWGASLPWFKYQAHLAQQERVQAVLSSIKGPDELVTKLKAHLARDPKSARGWYLLGRLYASQQQWDNAYQAFSQAHQLKPDDVMITVNYAQSLLAQDNLSLNQQGREILYDLLKKDPNQPDTLAMLAMDAYNQQHYQQAIDYWQQLLAMVPAQSEEAQALSKAIAKAQGKLKSE